MTAKISTEEQMVGLVRNALLVAGHEMGDEGDHWPVINSTIASIMKDLEALQTELNVSAEIKIHFGEIIRKLEEGLHLCEAELRPEAEKLVKNLREIYEARFAPMDMTTIEVPADMEIPVHIKRAEAIIKTLEDENG